MGKSVMHFLALKPWHPSNMRNQRRVWTAEQKAKQSEIDEAQARREIDREERRMREQNLAAARGDKEAIRDIKKRQMAFMYAAPPGFEEAQTKITNEDDEATLQFKRNLIRSNDNFSGATISKLERAVGRKEKKGLTLDELIERHPELKNAPLEGHYAKNVKLTFKPFGKVLHHVRCMRCGEIGHVAGDRICKKSNAVDTPCEAARRTMEDPLLSMSSKSEISASKTTSLDNQNMFAGAAGREFLAKLTKKEKKTLLKHMSKKADINKKKRQNNSDSDICTEASIGNDSTKHNGQQRKRKHKKRKKHDLKRRKKIKRSKKKKSKDRDNS